MRKLLVLTILSLTALHFLSFNEKQQMNSNRSQIFEIKYEELLKQKNKYVLSHLASNIEYVVLETNDNCLIQSLASYIFCDSLIFVSNKDHVLKFSSKGKFLKRIGNPGRGPGEINTIWTMSVLPDIRNVVVYDAIASKLIYYSFDGTLIKTVRAPNAQYIKVMNDNKYIIYELAAAKSEHFYFYLTDESQDTISFVKNYYTWINKSGMPTIFSYPSLNPFYYYKSKYYFKTLYNDTVYTVSNNRIVPCYSINLGKYKLPENKRAERLDPAQAKSFRANSADYYNSSALEVAEKIFITTRCFGEGPTLHFIINKADFYGTPTPDYKNVSKGILMNDFDGGLFFWPEGTISEKKAFMAVDVTRIKKYFGSTHYKDLPIKYKEKQKQLHSLVSNLDITSNPILMLVTFK